MQNGTDWSPSLVVYGDLGADNAQFFSQLQQEVQRRVLRGTPARGRLCVRHGEGKKLLLTTTC